MVKLILYPARNLPSADSKGVLPIVPSESSSRPMTTRS